MERTDSDSKVAALPYVPFQSFCTALDHLKSHGTPDKIDSSVFPTFSGSIVSHLLLAMRFLGLIDEKGRPQPALAPLVDEKTRKQAMGKLIPTAYSALFKKVDLAKASPSMLDEAVRSQNARGATTRKAKVFLIKAAQYSGLPVSSHLLKRSRPTGNSGSKGSSAPRKTKEREEHTKTPHKTELTNDSPERISAVTVKLPEAGGTLTLSGDFDALALRGAEREFVYKLADLMRGFGMKGRTQGEK